MRIFIITLFCLALAAPASAGMYKWTDKDGKIHFTDNPSRIPVDSRNKKSMKRMKPSNLIKQSSPLAASSRVTFSTPAPKHVGGKKICNKNKKAGINNQKVKDLQRLVQKKHYNH